MKLCVALFIWGHESFLWTVRPYGVQQFVLVHYSG
jgi:hypothetical protein